ncbi:unnamed protein product [Vicia faba]|uniref:Uncharacterized protein n=1 Tax=Vicia faba TaxID=3906 RepID=A0AAV0Z898_VICFA|nr:unnamed protein product [Vicia faba]
MKHNNKQVGSVSETGTTRTDFEFPTGVLTELPNDVVLFGKVITRKTEPQTRKENAVVPGIRSPSGKESRCRRSGSERKRYTGIFGMVKFPLQMELSDIKMRQERKEPVPLPKFMSKEDGGGESCWEMVRPLRRRGTIISALKASFGCIHIKFL